MVTNLMTERNKTSLLYHEIKTSIMRTRNFSQCMKSIDVKFGGFLFNTLNIN